jgi:hypothetical protein
MKIIRGEDHENHLRGRSTEGTRGIFYWYSTHTRLLVQSLKLYRESIRPLMPPCLVNASIELGPGLTQG